MSALPPPSYPDFVVALAVLLVIALVSYGVYMNFAAPCDNWLFQITPAAELPGRCVMPSSN